MVFAVTLLEHEIDDIIRSFVYYLETIDFSNVSNTAETIADVYCDMETEFLETFEPVANFTSDICPILYHTFILYLLETNPHIHFPYGATTAILQHTSPLSADQIDEITTKINKLKSIPQPMQRTPEWYAYRYNLITASNAYKALGTPAAQNSLIYEKCKPLTIPNNTMSDTPPSEFKRMINTNLPTHWGQRYEPISVEIYEIINRTHIADFGCIPHSQYSFLGASPDGINDDPTSPLYGRMLEIKNVVSREITGVPKHDYAVQMQLQMEVCDLDTCDFLETKFVEFDHKQEFYESIADADEIYTVQEHTIPAFHGIILQFQYADSEIPTYIPYIWNPAVANSEPPHIAIPVWEKQTISDTLTNAYGNTLIRFVQIHYWKLEVYSCILVYRDREWFKSNIPCFSSIWDTVLKERVEGYEHRAPKKRPLPALDSKPITDYPGFTSTVDDVKTIIVTDTPFRNPRTVNAKFEECMF